MKIIKHGNPKVLEKVNQRFMCPRCGCEFVANWDEYEETMKVSLGVSYWRECVCPDCGRRCNLTVR